MSETLDEASKAVEKVVNRLVEEDFIIIDSEPGDRLSRIVRKVFGDVTTQSAVKQAAIGTGTGWVSGFLTKQVGKMAVITIGATIVLIQVGQHNGIITINWSKVQRALTRAEAQAEKEWKDNHKYIGAARKFYKDNFYLAAGFTGGFLFALLW